MVEYEERRIAFALASPGKLFTPFVTVALILMLVGFISACYFKEFTVNQLCLSTAAIYNFRLWQLLTFPFVNVCIMNFIFHCMIVLFMGSTIEREWDTKSLIILWLVTSLPCALLWLVINILGNWNFVGAGTGVCTFGLIAAFGLLLRKKLFIFWFWTLEAQKIAIILIVIGLLFCIPQPINLIWMLGALIAYLYIKFIWRSGRVRTPARSNGNGSRGAGFVDLD